jgi:hypothetical protein
MSDSRRRHLTAAACVAAALGWAASGAALADQGTATGNAGAIAASASLEFEITVNKFVMLRVGNADASVSDVTFTVAVNPAVAGSPGNRLAYSGTAPPAFTTSVATSNPSSGAGALQVAAFTNVTGTNITCALSALPGATAFANGATSGGVPGTSTIKVTASGGGVPHPGADLSACNGVTSAAVPVVTNLTGTYTYSSTFVASNLAAGTYGNKVTYTITAP